MPYPGEHSARIRDPKQYDSLRRRNNAFGSGIHVIYGIKNKPKRRAEVQAIRFDASKFTVAQAKAWLKKHKYKPIRFEPATREKKAAAQTSYRCECLKCGHQLTTTKHCRDLRCPKCGGPMRRVERPGPGQASAPADWLASAPTEFLLPRAPVIIEAAADDQGKLPTFQVTAYTGGRLRVAGFYQPVVIDLSGMSVPDGAVPILLNHDENRIVGHAPEVQRLSSRLKLSGVVSGSGDAAREVVENARNGFPWQASVAVRVESLEEVKERANAQANGRSFSGPLVIARRSWLAEVSFVPRGADAKTNVKIAATAAISEGGTAMEFQEWLEGREKTAEELSADELAMLRAEFDAEMKAAGEKGQAEEKAEGSGTTSVDDPPAQLPASADVAGRAIEEIRASASAETKRIAEIRRLFAGKHAEIEAEAIAEGWSTEKAELELLRAERPKAPAFHDGHKPEGPRVLEAALRMGAHADDERMAKEYDGPTLEAAHRMRHIGLRELVATCCTLDGHDAPRPGASRAEWERAVEAAFSTVSLPGILGATANKTLLDAYKMFPSAARRIAKKLSANDFKTHTGYRMTGNSIFEEVGADGELKHLTLGEESFTFSVATYGKIIGITRQSLINDDLGAFTQLPAVLGRGAAVALEEVFFTLVLANTGSFFSAANGNYVTGAAYVLGIAGLNKAVQTLAEITDANGKPVLIMPKFLLVPPALKGTADALYKSTKIVTGDTDQIPDANVHAGMYEPIMSSYLGNTSFHANASSTAYYLLGDPADVACFGIAFLKGDDQPVVEEGTVDSRFLGKSWRAYLDFGVCQIDERGGVMMTGAA